ncbi:MAG: hypothetical protein ACRC62_16730 [Microcoleus sp.]
MAIAPLFQQQIEAAQQRARSKGLEQGLERGLERGRQEQQRSIFEHFLQVRFAELTPKMTAFISPISLIVFVEQLPQLSTDELRERLGEASE